MKMSEQQLRFLNLMAVSGITGLKKTSIYTLQKQGFPKPIKISAAGRQSGARWVESEIYAWMNSRIQLRDNNPAPPPAQQKANTLELVS
jgi:predicted DNA-binding transcriptional regulator AlpA